jgi:hypothetical protein
MRKKNRDNTKEYAVSQNFRLVGYVKNPIYCRDLPMFYT